MDTNRIKKGRRIAGLFFVCDTCHALAFRTNRLLINSVAADDISAKAIVVSNIEDSKVSVVFR